MISSVKKISHHIIQFSKNLLKENTLSKLSKTFLVVAPFFVRIFFLHRKEVIHPHVLVGIPCYDFTPITYPTFCDPLHKWLGYRIRVLQTFVA